MSNNSGFGDINNCNSLNISVVSSTIVNSIRRNSFYKLTNVLLLFFLLFGSCVVSFGMETGNDENKENKENEDDEKEQQYENKAQESILHAQFKVSIQENFYEQSDDNDSKQEVNTLKYLTQKLLEPKDITHLIRFLICMDLIDRDRFINDKDIKSSGYYYPWYLKHHIFTQPFYRGLGGTKQFSSKYKFIGCDWYFGIGNVPYVGGFLTLAFVCKPTKYLPPFLQNKVTIHIFDFKPFYFLITYFLQKEYRRADDYFSPGVVGFAIYKVKKNSYIYDDEAALILHNSFYLGLFVVQVKITEYYDISVNLFGWLLGKLVYKFSETINKFIKHKKKNLK